MMRRLIGGIAILSALVAAGCGSDDEVIIIPASPTGTPTRSATPEPTTPATDTPTVAPPTATATEVAAATETPTAAAATATETSTETATATPTTTPTEPEPTATLSGNPILDLPVDETQSLEGLSSIVDVVFDELGIPHIVGSDLESVAFLQGYLHASARFWQMDAFRRFAEGRLSEILGALTYSTDVANQTYFRTRDGRRIEEAVWERVQNEDPEGAEILQTYTNGINAWLADLRAGRNGATLPPEYRSLLVNQTANQLVDWRPQDSLAIGRLQMFTLSESSAAEVFLARVRANLPEEVWRDVFRFMPLTEATVIPREEEAESATQLACMLSNSTPPPSVPPALLEKVDLAMAEVRNANPLGGAQHDVGSNNFIVAPSQSATGHAMLANDPHLQLFNPPIWYMVQLDAAGPVEGPSNLRLNGVNFPGLPGVILGNNDFGAWGGTVSYFDVTDVYVETVTTPPDYPASPRTVLFNGEQVDVLRLEVPIIVKNQGTRTAIVEIVPHHGPMLPDPNLNDDVVGLAATGMTFRWTGHEVGVDSRFLLDLSRARNVDEFRAALANFTAGGQNWVWADIDGNIAYLPYVLVPQRPPGTVPYLPLPGTGEAEWLADEEGNPIWLPVERFPQATNPAAGYLATANNDQIGTNFDNDPANDDVYLGYSYESGFRAQRILDMLSNRAGLRPEGAPMSPADLSRYQYDTSSLEASRLLPFLFDAAANRADLVTAPMQEALTRLEEWGVSKPGTAPGAVAYDVLSGIDAADLRSDVTPRETPVSDEERADAAATSIFVGWTTRLSRLTFADDFAGTGIGTPGGQDATRALLHILEHVGEVDDSKRIFSADESGQSTLWDNKTTEPVETRDEILLQALSDGLAFLETRFASADQSTWLWGRIHQADFQHFFAQGGIGTYDLTPFAAPGGRFTVNPASYSLNSDNFNFAGGPSMRFVVDLDPDGVRAVNILPGGNNGNPGGQQNEKFNTINPAIHYGDQIPGWLNGGTYNLHLSREDVAAHSAKHLRFIGE